MKALVAIVTMVIVMKGMIMTAMMIVAAVMLT